MDLARPSSAIAWTGKALMHGHIVAHTGAGQHEHFPKSIEAVKKALDIDPNLSDAYSARLKSAYRKSGWRGVQIERIRTAETNADLDFFRLAGLYAKVGDKDKALECLERVYLDRSFLVPILHVEPQLASLHEDPRFIDLVRRIEGK